MPIFANKTSFSKKCIYFFQGGSWTVGRHVVHAEETIAEGGFGVVFLVKGSYFSF